MTEDDWTVTTLREYVLALIASNEVKSHERFEAQQVAMQTAQERCLGD